MYMYKLIFCIFGLNMDYTNVANWLPNLKIRINIYIQINVFSFAIYTTEHVNE